MDFQSVNLLNVRLNLLSGNLLPITSHRTPFSLFWKIYSFFVWVTQLLLAIVIISGCMYVPLEKALTDGMVCLAVFTEMTVVIVRIHAFKDEVRHLIQNLDNILHDNEIMKNIVTAILKPVAIPLNFYWSAGVASIIAWNCIPLLLVFEKNLFLYEDYRMPATFSKQPFSLRVFLLGSLFITISGMYIFLKKVGMDVYMVHLVLMTTAQYRYVALKLAMIFEERNECNESQKNMPELIRRTKERKMTELCHHHNVTIHMTLLLKKVLSLNFSLIYINSVFRFCFIGIMLSTIPSSTFWEGISITMYASGAVVQLYILCSCVQQLLDASTEVTDMAFHDNWFLLEPSMKSTFFLMIMANKLECKLATFENFNLSLPSFMTILNQSYTISLLFLKMK